MFTTPPDTFIVKTYTTGGSYYQRLITCENITVVTGDVTISKAVDNRGFDVTCGETFEFKVELFNDDGSVYAGTYVIDGEQKSYDGKITIALEGEESVTISGIEEGTTYVVSEIENEDSSYELSEATLDGKPIQFGASESVTGSVVKDGSEVVFTNALKTRNIIVNKVIAGLVDQSVADETEFLVDVKYILPDGSSYGDGSDRFSISTWGPTVIEVPSGWSYEVWEMGKLKNADPTEFEPFAMDIDGSVTQVKSYDETIVKGDMKTEDVYITFYNKVKTDDDSACLVLEKSVVGAPDNSTATFRFRIALTDKSGLPYDTSNTYAINYGDEQTYDAASGIVVELSNRDCVVISGLEEGTRYVITEIDENGDAFKSLSADGGVYTSLSGTSVGQMMESSAWVLYKNQFTEDEPEVKTLTLSKTVVMDTVSEEHDHDFKFEFNVTLYDAHRDVILPGSGIEVSGDGTWVQLASGKYVVKLGDGESLTFSGLPETYNYLIKEIGFDFDSASGVSAEITKTESKSDDDAYGSGSTIMTIGAKDNKADTHIDYKNYVTEYESLSFTKILDLPDEIAEGYQTEFDFEVCLEKDGDPFTGSLKSYVYDASGIDSEYQESEVVFENGKATVTLETGYTFMLADLECGHYSCSIQELNADEYAVSVIISGDDADLMLFDADSAKVSMADGMALSNRLNIEFINSKQSFSFSKQDVAGGELAGAVIELRDAEGATVETWVSDGTVHEFVVKPGEYTLVETAAPEGYLVATEISVTVGADGSVAAGGVEVQGGAPVVMVDGYADTAFFFSKRNAVGDELEGAALELRDVDGNVVEKWISDGTEREISVQPGSYTLVETAAPEGYAIATSIAIFVNIDGSIKVDGIEFDSKHDVVVMVDDYLLNDSEIEEVKIKFSKRDAAGDELAGATIELWDEHGNIVSTWISDGTVHELTLEPGVYEFVETAAPEGYLIATSIEVVVGEDGSVTATNTEIGGGDGLIVMVDNYEPISNPEEGEEEGFQEHRIAFSKRDVAGDELAGAVIELRDAEGATVETWVSDGTVHEFFVEPGEYTLVETSAPEGYLVATSIHVAVSADGEIVANGVTVSGDDGLIVMVDHADTDVPLVPEESEEINIRFSKRDIAGNELAGAVIEISNELGEVIERWTSDGEAREFSLAPGIYTFVEIAAPSGYHLATNITMVIGEDGSVAATGTEVAVVDNVIVMVDDAIVEEPDIEVEMPSFSFSKRDVAGNELAGAVIELSDVEGNVIERWTSDGEARTIIVEPGTYKLVEIAAPEGYHIATAITVVVAEDGTVTTTGTETATTDNIVVMVDHYMTHDIVFSKTDVAGNELAGATIELRDATGNLVDAWVSDGTSKKISLEPGIYTFIETAAPEGYEIATAITIEIALNGTVTATGTEVAVVDNLITMVDDYAEMEIPEDEEEIEVPDEEDTDTPDDDVVETPETDNEAPDTSIEESKDEDVPVKVVPTSVREMDEPIPVTGDSSPLTFAVVAAFLGFFMMGAGVMARRKY